MQTKMTEYDSDTSIEILIILVSWEYRIVFDAGARILTIFYIIVLLFIFCFVGFLNII